MPIDPIAHFAKMIPNCLAYAKEAKAQGRKIVGIMCEFTPREVIMAAGAVPVCLCGGSAKTIPAAEQHLPTNLCPLIKSTYGYHVQGNNPFLEMADLIVAETTCDGKKKMYELMGQRRPMHVLELPNKSDRGEAMEYWHGELVEFRKELERRFGVAITDDRLREAIRVMNRERRLRRRIAELMMRDVPPITGRQLIEFKSSISGIEADLAVYEEALRIYGDAGGTAVAPSKNTGGTPVLPPSDTGGTPVPLPPRVLLTGVPLAHGAERVLEIIENAGGVVVCMENCTGLKPILEDVDENHPDPLRAIAEKYYHLPCSVMTRNDARLRTLKELAAKYRVECVIDLIWQACLTYDVESHRVRKLADDELKLPYLRIETDYSPSDSARIQVRVEALFETVRQRRSKS